MIKRLFRLTPFLAMLLLCACAIEPGGPSGIETPVWPPLPADEIDVHASLKQLVDGQPSLKVVLRVPNVTLNVTQSTASANTNNSLNGAYDEIEKTLFKAGFVVRDRALLSSLIDKEGITSYQEIQKRVDTDLIIDISSLEFNDAQSILVSRAYLGADGAQVSFTPDYPFNMGQAVATVEAKLIIVHTGEVAGIVTLRVPLCEQESCPFDFTVDDAGNPGLAARGLPNHVSTFDQSTKTAIYWWSSGTGPGSMSQAADLIGQKIVAVLKQ